MEELSTAPVVSIVDDDEWIRVALVRLLRLHRFSAYAFASAEEFLQSACAGETSCLITDVRMPGMSGVELQSHLIAQDRQVPVIFITAFPEDSARRKALESGAVCFLAKPFDAQALIDCLDEALKRTGKTCSDKTGRTQD